MWLRPSFESGTFQLQSGKRTSELIWNIQNILRCSRIRAFGCSLVWNHKFSSSFILHIIIIISTVSKCSSKYLSKWFCLTENQLNVSAWIYNKKAFAKSSQKNYRSLRGWIRLPSSTLGTKFALVSQTKNLLTISLTCLRSQWNQNGTLKTAIWFDVSSTPAPIVSWVVCLLQTHQPTK